MSKADILASPKTEVCILLIILYHFANVLSRSLLLDFDMPVCLRGKMPIKMKMAPVFTDAVFSS
jgi:hypothetical protein